MTFFFKDFSDAGAIIVAYENENIMIEEVFYPETIFDGLSYIGGLVSTVLGVFALVLDRLNKKQFDKKLLRFMRSK